MATIRIHLPYTHSSVRAYSEAKARWFGKCVRDFAAMYRVSRIIQVKDGVSATRLRVHTGLTKPRHGPRNKHVADLVDRSFSLPPLSPLSVLLTRAVNRTPMRLRFLRRSSIDPFSLFACSIMGGKLQFRILIRIDFKVSLMCNSSAEVANAYG